ncbi:MAG: hypothetical protein AAB511_04145 [Patescibacteria group bacterium]
MNRHESATVEAEQCENQGDNNSADQIIGRAMQRHASDLVGLRARLEELNFYLPQFRSSEKAGIEAEMQREIDARAADGNRHEQVDFTQLEERYKEYIRRGVGGAAKLENFTRVTEEMIARKEALTAEIAQISRDLDQKLSEERDASLQIAELKRMNDHDDSLVRSQAELVLAIDALEKRKLALERELGTQ